YLFLPYFYQKAVVDNCRNRGGAERLVVGRFVARGRRCAGFDDRDKRAASRLHDAHERTGKALGTCQAVTLPTITMASSVAHLHWRRRPHESYRSHRRHELGIYRALLPPDQRSGEGPTRWPAFGEDRALQRRFRGDRANAAPWGMG